MHENLKIQVFDANMALVRHGLVIHTWGNASARDQATGHIVIKPSGVSYERLKPDDMVVLDAAGNILEGNFAPSTDTPTHLHLYSCFGTIGAVVHTHSTYASSWAQACRPIPPFGTTHADHYNGEVPCTRALSDDEIGSNYEVNTGKVIAEIMAGKDPLAVPSVLVGSHGPFCWGSDPANAVYNAVALEEIARMALYTILLGRHEPVNTTLLEKHFLRKHGKNAYYGQKNNNQK